MDHQLQKLFYFCLKAMSLLLASSVGSGLTHLGVLYRYNETKRRRGAPITAPDMGVFRMISRVD
jgi:hypothetical protein